MASGPEHYRAAETVLLAVEQLSKASHGKQMTVVEAEALRSDMAISVAAAQVHATLALAAATTGRGVHGTEWVKVLQP